MEETKENQEMIFLKHRVPRYHMEEDTRQQETVKLRHVVPYFQLPEQAQPPEKQSAPRFTQVSRDLTLLDGHVARLDCKFEPASDPYLRVEWYHNKRPLVHGSRFQTFTGPGHVFLNITSCIKEDSGSYVCVLTNKLGTDQVEINVQVIKRSDLAIEELDEEEKQAIFRILEDSSRFYRETVVEEKATRIPRFVKPFRRLRVNEGDTAYFETRIEPVDDPTMRVSWFHNSKELHVGSRWQHLHDFGFVSLHIRHCIDDDRGQYVCRIENSDGFAETSVPLQVLESSTLSMDTVNPESVKQITSLEDDSRHHVTVKEREFRHQTPKFVTKFRSQCIREREKAHFEARFEPVDDGSLKIDWFLNGKELQVGSRWQHFHDFGFVCLNILKCVADDTGEYVCRLTSSAGVAEQPVSLEVRSSEDVDQKETFHKFRYLEDASRFKRETESDEQIRHKPRFLTPFHDVELRESQAAHFECRIEPVNDSSLRVEWLFNGKELTVGHRFQPFHDFGFVSLNILQCVEEDTGSYTCRITNEIGSAEQSVSLKIYGLSSLLLETQHPDSLQQIQHLEDGRRYTRTEEEESVITAPKFWTTFRSLTINDGQHAHFECRIEPAHDSRLRVEWFKDGKQMAIGSRYQYVHDFGFVCMNIVQTVAEDTGRYTCRLTNDYGSAESSVDLTVRDRRRPLKRIQYVAGLARAPSIPETRVEAPSFVQIVETASYPLPHSPSQETSPRIRDAVLAPEGEVVFECAFTGIPVPNITWFQENRVIWPSSKFQVCVIPYKL